VEKLGACARAQCRRAARHPLRADVSQAETWRVRGLSPFSFGRVNPFPVYSERDECLRFGVVLAIVSRSNVNHAVKRCSRVAKRCSRAVKRDLSPQITICASSPAMTPNALLPWAVGGSRTAGAVGRTHADCLHAGKLPDFRWSLERIHESGSVLPTAAPRPDFVNRRISTFCLGDYRRIPDLCLISRTRYGRFRCESKISRLLPRWPYRQAIRTRLPAYPAPHTQLPARRIPHIQRDNRPQPPERVDGGPTPDPTGYADPLSLLLPTLRCPSVSVEGHRSVSADAQTPLSVGRRLKCARVHACSPASSITNQLR
jgi:hypothetical protein